MSVHLWLCYAVHQGGAHTPQGMGRYSFGAWRIIGGVESSGTIKVPVIINDCVFVVNFLIVKTALHVNLYVHVDLHIISSKKMTEPQCF